MEAITPHQLSEHNLLMLNERIRELMKGECIFIHSPMCPPLDDQLRVVLEYLADAEANRLQKHLIVILETRGGYMECVERLVSVMRKHYKEVSFVIPNFAYSAGTVLVLSGDNIHMDYYSVLGPIDPQYGGRDRDSLPGVGYLEKFKELVKKINGNDDTASCTAELTYLVKNFDPALLFRIEQNIDHGISLIKKWLPKYKFKNWKTTEERRAAVNKDMKQERAKAIAEVLGDAKEWHSHGRGISMEELRSDKIKLQIDDFGQNKDLSHAIRHYHGLATNHYIQNGVHSWIHSREGLKRVM